MSSHPEQCSAAIFQMPVSYAALPTATDWDISCRKGYVRAVAPDSTLLAEFGTPPPAPSDLRTFTNPAAGKTDTIPAGTWTNHLDIPPEAHDYTIQGAGRLVTLLDGQGGAGSGHRLSFGKGIIHTRAANTVIQDVGFINGGGADNVSDGEAGFYAGDGQTGLATLRRCDFSRCEDGIFTQAGSGDLLIDACSFGTTGPNGLSDGRSHDNYVNGASVSIVNSFYVGNSEGNEIKTRSRKLLVKGTYVGRVNGRWIDMPGGTDATSSNNVYVTLGTNSQNAFGLDDELDDTVNPGKAGSFLSVDDAYYFQRFAEVFWVNHVASRVEFVRPRVFWIGQAGATPPSVVIQGPGGIVNTVSPFVFDESNRVGAPPPPPVMP